MEEGPSEASRSARSKKPSLGDELLQVGNYRLMKTIGKGNFAKVKLARHTPTGREVRLRAREDAGKYPPSPKHTQN